MGKITVHEFVSLDGVFESPSWTAEFGFTEGMGAALAAITGGSSAILLGRRTFEMFAPAWSTRSVEDDPGVPFFNDSPKYVVSSTLTSADAWQNSTVLGGYDPEVIRRLKDDAAGDVYISGSGTLVRALLADGLVDALHLFVFPLALGAGERLFAEGSEVRLALQQDEAYDSGVVHLAYGPAGQEG